MKKQNDYIYIEKNDEFINLEGLEIKVPIYVKKALKRYRLNVSNLTLERQCFKCLKWLAVANVQNDDFIIISDSRVRYLSDKSGFDCRCDTCSNPNTSKSFTSNKNGEEEIINISIAKDIKKYYKAMSFINDTALKECITIALREYMDKNPIDSIKL